MMWSKAGICSAPIGHFRMLQECFSLPISGHFCLGCRKDQITGFHRLTGPNNVSKKLAQSNMDLCSKNLAIFLRARPVLYSSIFHCFHSQNLTCVRRQETKEVLSTAWELLLAQSLPGTSPGELWCSPAPSDH